MTRSGPYGSWAINFGTIPSLILIGAAIAHARLDRGPRRTRYYFVIASQLVPFLMFAAAVVFSLAVSYDFTGQEARSGLASRWASAFNICPFLLVAAAALFRGPFALRLVLLLTVPASVALQTTIWTVLYPHHLELFVTNAHT